MTHKKLYVALVAFLLLHDTVQAKKSRRKRPQPEEEDNTPQPSVVSYSTFGFNDVGTYEGFVPSSPDYAKFLSGGGNQESTKDQSFPTSPETNDYGNNFGSSQQFNSGQSFGASGDAGPQAGLVQYPQNSMGLFNTPTFDTNVDQHRNIASEEIYGRNTEDVNAPIYGTKINSRNKMRPDYQYNNTDFPDLNSSQSDDKFLNFHNAKPSYDNRPFQFSEPSSIFHSAPNYPSSNVGEFNKPTASDSQNPFKFQKVVDFTHLTQNYQPELDTSRMPPATPIPDVFENSEPSQNMLMNSYHFNNSKKQSFNPAQKHKDSYRYKQNSDENEKHPFKSNNNKDESYSFSSITSSRDNLLPSSSESKKKSKNKPWSSGGHVFNKWKEPTPSKGYEYSTNYSSMSFKYDTDEQKMSKPLGSSIDELVPASSNIDSPNFQFPDNDFSNFKKMPEYKVHEDEEDFPNFPSFKDTKPSEFDYNQYKHLFTTTPATTTSFWGNVYKTEYSSIKHHPTPNKYKFKETGNDAEVVNIPRRPNRFNFDKPYENKHNEWSSYNRRPHKSRPWKDWPKEVPTTRFKSEEDLLGLRNQDTSYPSYLPSYQSSNYVSEDNDYKKVVEKWRQSYLKSKYKDSLRDYESYGTETKPMHVPVPKPYPIEVAHPVIVPIPQPYPVRIPIAKPVAVPVIREIKIPVEKPMPYLVYKDVPYPIEKLVPVPVEKEVPVPVVKPYPVHIPYIRPVFHHTKSRDEYDSDHRDDDDYIPRPEGNKKYSPYRKKVNYSSRNRSRRPSRTAYQDRNRRRWPERRHQEMDDLPRVRPIEVHYPSPFKRRDSEPTRFQDEPSRPRCLKPGTC